MVRPGRGIESCSCDVCNGDFDIKYAGQVPRHLPHVGSLESDREGSYCLVTLVRLLDSLHTYEFIGLDLTCTDVCIRSIEVGPVVVDVGEGEGASLGV